MTMLKKIVSLGLLSFVLMAYTPASASGMITAKGKICLAVGFDSAGKCSIDIDGYAKGKIRGLRSKMQKILNDVTANLSDEDKKRYQSLLEQIDSLADKLPEKLDFDAAGNLNVKLDTDGQELLLAVLGGQVKTQYDDLIFKARMHHKIVIRNDSLIAKSYGDAGIYQNVLGVHIPAIAVKADSGVAVRAVPYNNGYIEMIATQGAKLIWLKSDYQYGKKKKRFVEVLYLHPTLKKWVKGHVLDDGEAIEKLEPMVLD